MPQLFGFFNKTECDLFKMIAFRPPSFLQGFQRAGLWEPWSQELALKE